LPEETFLLGAWKNKLGSGMNIHSQKEGKFSGTYISNVGTAAQRSNSIEGAYIQGKEGYLLTFHAEWINRPDSSDASITTWIGKYSDGVIRSTWMLFKDDGSLNNWSSVVMNQDVFELPNFK
jgi:hypothetical protein